MRRRSPLPLIPLAFVTLACGNPTGGVPEVVLANHSSGGLSQRAPAPPTKPASGDAARTAAALARDNSAIRFGRTTPLPKKPGTIRLAEYNVENLFDDKDDPKLSGDFEDIKMTATPERLTALAATIKSLDADVLAVTEVESKDALVWFRDGYLKGLGYDYVESIDAGDPRGIEQGVLSRIPIVGVENWPNEAIIDMKENREGTGWATPSDGKWPKRWARSPLEVRLKAPDGYELTLLVVHHKASGKFDAQRELEALQVREIAMARLKKNPNENLAIVGDFNATPSKKSVKVYLETESPRLRSAYDQRFQKNAPSDTFITHVTNRPIDFIIMSPGLFKDTVDESFFVLGTPLPPKGAPIDGPKPAGYASDHLPIAIDLRSDVRPRSDAPKGARD
ncbi:MAG: endonuclease/exonuclease/phosphatase family protein [Phycisphaerae bacterium]|nr:endonuclease/exonuclease/phosphatase family protein [Phycisphaerae bacterium]